MKTNANRAPTVTPATNLGSLVILGDGAAAEIGVGSLLALEVGDGGAGVLDRKVDSVFDVEVDLVLCAKVSEVLGGRELSEVKNGSSGTEA